jgi:hypothetical protein
MRAWARADTAARSRILPGWVGSRSVTRNDWSGAMRDRALCEEEPVAGGSGVIVPPAITG